jgi:hypothetical protein
VVKRSGMIRRIVGATVGLLGLALVIATPAAAAALDGSDVTAVQQRDNGCDDKPPDRGNDGGGHNSPFCNLLPSPSETPELSSIALFGTGAVGMASYGLLRLRAARRRR